MSLEANLDCPVQTTAIAPGRPANESGSMDFDHLAIQVLSGYRITSAEAVQLLRTDDSNLLELLAAAYKIRRQYFGNTVQLYFLMNAKSGLCPEDCSYCSQSKTSTAEIPRYNLLRREEMMDGARVAYERGSSTYCLVISARGPNEREMRAVEEIVPRIKQQYPLNVCACLGLLTDDQAKRLAACGVDQVNHNLNTSAEHYVEICSTHTFQDRLDTLKAVRSAGMKICSGGILGMGQTDEDVVSMAMELRDIRAEMIPVNFLNPIDGTPLAGKRELNPRQCLKALAMFRFTNPTAEIRIAGGRELHLGSMQCLGLYAANSMFVGDYLTTKGQLPEADYRMIQEMGFVIIRHDGEVLELGVESQGQRVER